MVRGLVPRQTDDAQGLGSFGPPPKPAQPAGRLKGRERHMLPGWYEWALRELARYFYALLILSLLAFVPLQMGDSWLPPGAPPVLNPAAVTALAVAFVIGLAILAAFGYRFLWGEDGLVDRVVERHFDEIRDRALVDKE